MKKLLKNKEISKSKLAKIIASFFVVILVAYCAFTFASNYADISRLNAHAKDCDVTLSEQVKENDKIKAILDSDNKDEYIEQKAREKGYVKSGETVFYDISSSK